MKTTLRTVNVSLRSRKADLLAKRAELERAATHRDELIGETSPDEFDMIRMATDRDRTVEWCNQNDRVLVQVRAALDALERGDYGTCAGCEEPISPRRLEALPWAQLCIRCQNDQERECDAGGETTLLQAA
jgi:DnaK suppressor protein